MLDPGASPPARKLAAEGGGPALVLESSPAPWNATGRREAVFCCRCGWFMQCRGRAGREGGRGRTFAGHILYIVQNSPLIAR